MSAAPTAEVHILPARQREEGGLHGRVTPVGYHINPALSFDEWVSDGEHLKLLHNSTAFYIADWLIAGQAKFGEMHAQALGDYFSPETLGRYRRVGMAFPIQRRRVSLYFGHHDAVTGLTEREQDEVLDLAEQHRWSRTMTRDEVRRRKEREAAEKLAATAARQPRMIGSPDRVTDVTDGDGAIPSGLSNSSEFDKFDDGDIPSALPPEPPPQSADDAAIYLEALAGSTMTEDAARALRAVLGERKLLLRVLWLAQKSVKQGAVHPDLDEACAAVI